MSQGSGNSRRVPNKPPPVQENKVNDNTSYSESEPSQLISNKGSISNSDLYFPDELASNSDYPFVRFKVVEKPISINLPMPPAGVSFADGADYSTLDLGIIGGLDDLGSTLAEGDFSTAMSNLGYGAVKGIAEIGKKIGLEKSQQIADLGMKRVVAKNTHVTFQSNTIRQFSFNFKLVAQSESEAKMTKAIVETFREELYGRLGGGMVVQYPKPFIIQFFNNANMINEYLPHIKQCYLTSLTSNYNSSTNLYHYDGAPIEVDVTLQFQETKALYKQDILLKSYQYA